MNWTEGSLARHKRKKGVNPEVAKQKQHFARVRAGKTTPGSHHSSDGQPEFIPSYMQRSPQSGHLVTSSSTSPQRRRQSPDLRRLLPVADLQGGSLGKSIGSIERPRDPVSPRSSSRDTGDSDLASKRRKILDKHDWIGVTLPQLTEVDFGKIRQQQNHPRTIYNGPKQLNTIPELDEDRHQRRSSRRHNDRRDSRHHSRYSRDKESIRMRIGDRNLRWSKQEGSIRSLHHSERSPGTPNLTASPSMASSPPASVCLPPLSSPLSRQSVRDRINPPETTIWRRRSPAKLPAGLIRRNVSAGQYASSEPEYVVQSVPPTIIQPVAAHFETSRLVTQPQMNSEDETSSTLAVVGKVQSLDPIAMQEDQQWKAFLAGGSYQASSACSNQPPSFTPGVSHYEPDHTNIIREPTPVICAVSHGTRTDRSEALAQEQGMASGGIGTSDRSLIQTLEAVPAEDTRKGYSYGQSTKEDTKAELRQLEANLKALIGQVKKSENLLDLLDAKQAKPSPPRQPEEDDDAEEEELWKRFIYDDDPDEISRKAEENYHNASKRQTRQTPVYKALSSPQSDEAEPRSGTLGEAMENFEKLSSCVPEMSTDSFFMHDERVASDQCMGEGDEYLLDAASAVAVCSSSPTADEYEGDDHIAL